MFDSATPGDDTTAASKAEVRMYFSKSPIKPDETIIDLYRDGGMYVAEALTSGHDAALVVSVVGKAASVVRIGAYDAALVHSSPFADGFQTWNLYWSDGTRDFSMISRADASDVVAAAQSLYC